MFLPGMFADFQCLEFEDKQFEVLPTSDLLYVQLLTRHCFQSGYGRQNADSCCLVASDSVDYSPPCSSLHEIL